MEPGDGGRRQGLGLPEDVHDVLLDVSRTAASCRDLRSLIRELAQVLRRIAHFDRVAIVLHDATTETMRLHTVDAWPAPLVTEIELPIEESPAGIAWRTQQPIVLDIDHETRFTEVLDILRREGMRSVCVLPLTSPLRRLGGLSFASRDANAFGETDVAFLRELTSHIALAVDNTLHHEDMERAQRELERERDRLRLLLEVNNALVASLDPRALFGAISAHLRRVVAHDYTSLAVYQPDQRAFDMWAIEFTGKGLVREHMSVPVEGSPAGIAFSTGKAARFGRAELEALSAPTVKLLLAEGIYSMCCVPLTVHDRRLGTLGLARVGDEPFSADDEELL